MNEKLTQVIETFKQKTKKQCYSIKLLDEEALVVDSKIGGVPYMNVGETYPKDSKGEFMPLFVQINFEGLDLKNYPKKGILQLFVDKSFSYPIEYKVRFIENVDENYNKHLPEVDLNKFPVQESIKIQLIPNETYMPINDFRFNETFCGIFNEIFNSNIRNFFDMDEVTGIKNSYNLVYKALNIESGLIGGYSDFTQSDPREYDKNLVDCIECLIKIDSNLDMDRIRIGDAGIAWLLISEEDLKSKHFEKAKFDWDCY